MKSRWILEAIEYPVGFSKAAPHKIIVGEFKTKWWAMKEKEEKETSYRKILVRKKQ